ncbi:AAA family ATPase [Candidatus Gracilibacteria bacterium]|nr:AAA family ATPase [Candidatus Gracilibacteria bacterium]
MKLTKVQLENFRNYTRYEYEFDPDTNLTILVGPNGKGKTNFLESIYVLSLGKSFRSNMRDDLIEWEMDYMRCQAEIRVNDEIQSLEVFYSNYPRKQKGLKKNDVPLKSDSTVR